MLETPSQLLGGFGGSLIPPVYNVCGEQDFIVIDQKNS